LPLQDENARAFGALTIYSAETDAFTPAEVRLLGELAGDLAFGITVLRGRIERAQAFQKVTQLAAIVESSDDAIIGKTLDGVVTSWNKGAEKIYGYGENEVLGKPVSMLVPPEHDDDTRQILARIRSGEHIERCETVRRTKDGRRVQMSLTISPVRDTEGRVVGASTIGRDITEHKQAQERLAESEAKYRIVADNTFDFEIWIDPQGRYVYASPSCERLTGYSAEDYIGDPGLARRIVHPDDLELFDCHIRDSHDRRLALEAEWRIVHKDNSIRWISHACQPVFSGNGGYLGARGSNRDITARKHAEQALRESEQRYKLLLNSVTDYIYTVKVEDGRPVSTIHGPGCAAVTGYTSGDYLADPELWLRMICEPDRAAVLEQVATILAGETAQPVEHRILHRDGSLRWVRNTPVSHYDQQRRLIGYDGLVSDITERKRAEEEQAKLWQHLQQAQKMEAIGRLAGGVAHDFNNLLTVINGYCELGMVRLKKGDPLHSDLEEIHSAGMRAAELTQQLLAFSRRQVAQPRVLNLNDQVRDAEKMLERVIGEDIELVCVLDPALGRTKADPVQIHQILMNLVVNARDAMPSGGKLVLGTENAEVDSRYAAGHWTLEPGSYAVLSVTDTGIGMNEEVKSHVFEPFFTTKPAGKGTGMGLATVFGIVQQSRGYITVYSEPDRGTTFRVFLPRASDSEAEEVRPSRSETRRGGDETILVVEDQQAVRSLTCALLRSVGYHVLEAANGGEALLACESHRGPIHLVITDVVMPQMSGPDLLSRLRLLRPEARSLYMSGYPEEIGLRSESLEGVVDYLPKPFGVDRLAGKVREILDR
jgi:PAS domain S-box-containing protein